MTRLHPFVYGAMWLTRVAGGVFALFGFGFFVSAWQAKSFAFVVPGLLFIAFGVACVSIRPTRNGGLEYGLFRAKR